MQVITIVTMQKSRKVGGLFYRQLDETCMQRGQLDLGVSIRANLFWEPAQTRLTWPLQGRFLRGPIRFSIPKI